MILKIGAWARDPLEYKIKNLNMAVFFFYGENDWMKREIADKLLNDIEKYKNTFYSENILPFLNQL